jgi:hypothetical protein
VTRSGSALGTVVRWDEARGGAAIEAAELPGGCWADASVIVGGTTGSGGLRAGQVVELEWVEAESGGLPFTARRVVRRGDLQATVGG